jgi:hypothetical protein
MRFYLLLVLLLQLPLCHASDKKSLERLIQYVDNSGNLNSEGQQYYNKDRYPELIREDLSVLYRSFEKSPEGFQPDADFTWKRNSVIYFLELLLLESILTERHRVLDERMRANTYDGTNSPLAKVPLDDLPNLDGATSTLPLRLVLISRMLGSHAQWMHLMEDGFFRMLMGKPQPWEFFPRVEPGRDFNSRRDARIHAMLLNNVLTPNSQTAHAYQKLFAEDNLLVINAVSPEAVANLAPGNFEKKESVRNRAVQQVLSKEQVSHIECKIIGYDALVALVHVHNPVNSLTLDQIRAIYRSPDGVRWNILSAAASGQSAVPLIRNPDSGTAMLMKDLVFNGVMPEIPRSAPHIRLLEMGALINGLSNFYAIGFSVQYYEQYICPSAYTKTLAVDGVYPAAETIGSGSYKLRAPIYAAIRRSEPVNSPARLVYDFLTTPDGQELIRSAGYYPLKPSR